MLTAILAAPFLLTTQLVRLALRQIFPVNSPTVGSAALSPSGTLVVRDLVLHDTAGLAQQPLITAREVDAAFGWTELLARQLRRIRIEGVTVYARRKGPSQISLLDLIPRESKPRAKPLWIGTLEIRGAVHSEPIAGFARTETDWPLSFQMITSGGPAGSRQFKVAIGDARRLGGNASKPSDTEPRPNAEGGFGMMAEFEAQAAAGGTRVTMRRLEASKAVVLIASDTLRHFVAKLPPELHGDVEASLGKLSASGELNPQPSTNARRIAGRLAFSGFRLRVPDSPQMMLSLEDVAGSARIDTLLPPGPGTSIRIERLQVGKSAASIEADVLRRYVAALPPDLHGRIDGDFAALEVSGHILSGTGGGMRFSGNVRLQDLAVRSPPDGKHAFTLDRLTTEGIIESRLDRWAPGTLKLRDGITRWAALTYGNNVLNNFDAAWRIDGQTLSIDRCETRIFGGRISGSPVLDLATHAMPPGDFQIKSIDMHEVLANLSPERIDAEGAVSGVVHLAASKMGELSGHVDLAFDGPGVLKIGEIQEMKQMLAGNFGTDLAQLAMHDLQHYPFTEGKLYLESLGGNSQLKIKFVRQPRTKADKTPPRKEIINGKEVWLGSLIVPTIDMTIPITGKSLADILSMASGVHPILGAVGEQQQ